MQEHERQHAHAATPGARQQTFGHGKPRINQKTSFTRKIP
ncbi:hypothetical protein D187_004704 [Cystobacter fuscus DSM 2262]|uniref:Uncharacterized protein n=1 Tax=Cystobacter fuscus (strain ATCC 25194 / DSM 2262 / NBRC 100088 / M29) TaxID=1242864 RepID=S9P048_CYSF2|nr:hypothetical protein D187_004704 [Cystobacter fuscus DSM 2262]